MNVLIVLNYNDYSNTYSFVVRIQNYSCIDKIIVVDNCSTDNSYQYLTALQSGKVDVICTTENNGYASGNNYGINYCKNKYGLMNCIFISNPDVFFEEEVAIKMIDVLDKNIGVACVAPIMKNADGKVATNFAMRIPSYFDVLSSSFLLFEQFRIKVLKKGGCYDINDAVKQELFYVDSLPGSFFAIKADVFFEVGLFSTKTFLYYEEAILAYRLKKIGMGTCVLSTKTFLHLHGTTINKNIKSWKKKEIIKEESAKAFLEEIGYSRFATTFFSIMFRVGMIERYGVLKIRKLIKNNTF